MTHSPTSTSSPLPQDKICWNCKTTQSPLWRKFNPTEPDCTSNCSLTTYLCNKCGLFFKRNKKQRPLDLDGPVNGSGSESPSISAVASPLIASPKRKKSQAHNHYPQQYHTTTTATTTKKRSQDEFLESSSPSSYESSVIGQTKKKKQKNRPTNSLTSMTSYSSSTTLTSSTTTSFTSSSFDDVVACVPSSFRPSALSRVFSSSNIADIHKAAALTIDSEDLDALLENTKKNKLIGNNGDAYLGVGSPIIQHSSSYSIVNCGQQANQANVRLATNNFKVESSNTLNQILMSFEQPAAPTGVTSTVSQVRTSDSTRTVPSHIVDWYDSDYPASQNQNNTDLNSLAELFGEEQVGLFDQLN